MLSAKKDWRTGSQYFKSKAMLSGLRHQHAKNLDIMRSRSYKISFILGGISPDQANRVLHWATQEQPPRAPSQAHVWETCQGWKIRVIRRLAEEKSVDGKWITLAIGMQEPLS